MELDEILRAVFGVGGVGGVVLLARRVDAWLDKRSDRAAEVRVRDSYAAERDRERAQDDRHEVDLRERDRLARIHLTTYCWPLRQQLINATGVDPGDPPPLIP